MIELCVIMSAVPPPHPKTDNKLELSDLSALGAEVCSIALHEE